MIKALITDFDGTLVDTFEANFYAYQEAFLSVGKKLTEEKYRACFGLRFDDFMIEMSIVDKDVSSLIKEYKKNVYPKYFSYLKLNSSLINLLTSFHKLGGKTAIASTASRENLMNAVKYLGISNSFDLIYAGVDVKNGKPSPEIYIKAMNVLNVSPAEVLIFEDSIVGFKAAKASGAQFVPVTSQWFDNHNF